MKVKFVISYRRSMSDDFIQEGTVAHVKMSSDSHVFLDCVTMSHKAFHTCCREIEDFSTGKYSWLKATIPHEVEPILN